MPVPDFRAPALLALSAFAGGGEQPISQVRERVGTAGELSTEDVRKMLPISQDEAYVQAKKYAESEPVGDGDLCNFRSAIDAAGTTKGVFVTTAEFTRAARDHMARSPKRIGEDCFDREAS